MDVASKSRLLTDYLLQIYRVTAFIAPLNKGRNYFLYSRHLFSPGGVPLFGSLLPVTDVIFKKSYLIFSQIKIQFSHKKTRSLNRTT